MIRIITSFIFIVFFLNGCLSDDQKQTIKENRIELGDIKINYYSDKSVTSLEVPPDLTSPSYENSFRISEFASGVDSKTVNLTNKELDTDQKEKMRRHRLLNRHKMQLLQSKNLLPNSNWDYPKRSRDRDFQG